MLGQALLQICFSTSLTLLALVFNGLKQALGDQSQLQSIALNAGGRYGQM